MSSKKSEGADAPAVEDTIKPQQDVDDAFKETVTRAITKVKTVEVPEKPTMDDQNKTFRTRLVAMWMLTNAGLAIAIENLNGLPNESDPEADEEHLRSKQNTYFAIILYSTFGLSLVRFIGVSYLFMMALFLFAHFALVLVLLLQAEFVQMLSQELEVIFP